MSDPLDEHIGAYRAVSDRSNGSPIETRSRLLRSVHRRHGRRQLAMAASILGAIVLTNATTWAWSTGRVEALLGGSAETEAIAPRRSPVTPAAAEPPSVPPEIAPRVPVTLLEGEAPATPTPTRPARRRPPRTAASEAPTPDALAARPEEDQALNRALDEALAALEDDLDQDLDGAERRAFQEAHDLHFGGDYARALRRWRAYLTRYPEGRFVPEARYNRAIALIRLGRFSEAQTALRTLAQGSGSHRSDAQRLLDAMDEGRLSVAPGE